MSQLRRTVGLPGAVLLGLGSILGTGAFVTLGLAAGLAGSTTPWVVAGAGVLALANGLSSAQLAAAIPVSGGTYEYGHRLIGPGAGFAAGWMFLVAKSASAATAALGFSAYTLRAFGVSNPMATVAMAVGFVGCVTWLVSGGLTRSNRANAVMVGMTLAGLTAFVVAAARSAPVTASSDVTPSVASLAEAAALVFVAYTGYGRIATLGEEVVEPAKTIPRAVVTTLAVAMALYVGVSWAGVRLVGAGEYAAAATGGAPLVTVLTRAGWPSLAPVVGVAALTAMAGVVLNLLLGLSRVVLAMARRGDLPGRLATIHSQGSPGQAVWGVGALVAGLCLIGDLKTTWSFSAFSVLLYYGITNLAALQLAPKDRRFPRVFAAFGLLTCVALAFSVTPSVILASVPIFAAGFGLRAWLRRGEAQ